MADNHAGWDNSDAEIIRLARSDCDESQCRALTLLDQKYGSDVQAFASRKLPSHAPEVAEDVRQETYAAVLLKIKKGNLKENGSLHALLFETADHKVADVFRSATRRREDSATDVAVIAQAHYDDPHALAELNQAISAACVALSDRERHVFKTRMEFVREEKRRPRFKELAELILGHIPSDREIDAVKRMYYRALKKVKAHLTKAGYWQWK